MLKQLRIDRSEDESAGSRSRGRWIAIVIGVLAVAGIGAWALLGRAARSKCAPALAQPVVTANTAGTSVLDASVTSRRGVRPRCLQGHRSRAGSADRGRAEGRRRSGAGAHRSIDAKAQWDMSAAQLEAARAQLAELRVQLTQAQRDEARQNDLVQKKLTSQQAADDARSRVQGLVARLAAQEPSGQRRTTRRGHGQGFAGQHHRHGARFPA
jgi:hypothetical protein